MNVCYQNLFLTVYAPAAVYMWPYGKAAKKTSQSFSEKVHNLECKGFCHKINQVKSDRF